MKATHEYVNREYENLTFKISFNEITLKNITKSNFPAGFKMALWLKP